MTPLSARRQEALADPSIPATLQSLRTEYEAKFGKFSIIEPQPILSFASLSEVTASTFNHREVVGTGNTAEEALADWKSWLDKAPQEGTELLWRIPPEFDCWCDFPANTLIWKVYARFVVIP